MFIALLLTIIIECSVLAILRELDKLFYLYWIVLTSITNLSINTYIIYFFSGEALEYLLTVVVLEVLVLICEFGLSFLYTRDFKKSLIYSLVCNLSSFLIGLLISSVL
jgi:hypothetical protein